MNIKSVVYLATVLVGFLLGEAIPFFHILGVGPVTLFLAMFLPYFGWKKTIIIYGCIYLFLLPYLLTILSPILDMGNNAIASMKTTFAPNIIEAFANRLPYLILFPIGLFLETLVVIYLVNRGLAKIGFYKRIIV